MAAISYSVASSNTKGAPYDATWNSLYSTMLKPQVWGELIQRFGYLPGLLDFLEHTGQVKNVKGQTITVYEEGALEKPIRIGSEISTGSAGADIEFTLHADEYDDNNDYYVQVGDDVVIPAAYQPTGIKTDRRYRVMSSTGSAGSLTFTASPVSGDGNTVTASQISTAVPSGTYLAVLGGSYAPGSQGAVAKSRGWYSRTFTTDIKRRAIHMEGSIQSDERYYENLKGGGKGMYTKTSAEADFLLSADINDALFLSEAEDNTSLVLADRNSANKDIRTTVGLWNHLDARGMEQTYSGQYDMDDFDLVKDYFLSQGVTRGDATFFTGSDLGRYIENSMLDFIREYSAGTDLTSKNAGMFREMGIGVNTIFKNGIRFMLFNLDSLSNVNKWAVSSLKTPEIGFIIPQQDVTVSGRASADGSYKLRNLTLGYKNYNGENRTRIIQPVSGVNGMGFPATDTYDDIRFELLSEFMLIANKVNQYVKVIPDTIS
jgi:hypothetical protein